jgi:hypothetical protein
MSSIKPYIIATLIYCWLLSPNKLCAMEPAEPASGGITNPIEKILKKTLSKTEQDIEIIKFISTVRESEKAQEKWLFFTFPIKNSSQLSSGLEYFKIRNLENKENLKFLQRISVKRRGAHENGQNFYATVIGEYEKKLYINFDQDIDAVAICDLDVEIREDTSNHTHFDSTGCFSDIFLGFYIILHDKYYEKAEEIYLKKNEIRKNNDSIIKIPYQPNLKVTRDAMFLQLDISSEILEAAKLLLKIEPKLRPSLSLRY